MKMKYAKPPSMATEAISSKLASMGAEPHVRTHALRDVHPSELKADEPHQVYTMRLDQLVSGDDRPSPSGWRFLLRQNDRAVAAAETITDDAGGSQFASLNRGPFVDGTVEALDFAGTLPDPAAGSYEPRLLDVPALHARALWLHGGDDVEDVAIPVAPTPPGIEAQRVYPLSEFLTKLRSQAEVVMNVGPDDLTGG
jgi:hypothetical protein